MRLVMDVPNVIIIIGVDHRIAFRAVGKSYQELADSQHTSDDIARDYLGKILQLAIVLSEPSMDELENFVKEGLFKDAVENGEKADGKKNESGEADDFHSEDIPDDVDPERRPYTGTEDKQDDNPSEGKPESDSKEKPESEGNPDDEDTEEKSELDSGNSSEKEDDLWQKEIEFSTDERDLFAKLVEGFELNNPRQLLRLRNSYGLLKLLHGMQLPTVLEKGDSDNDKTKLMILLFWKEFEANHPKWAEKIKGRWGDSSPSPEPQESPVIQRVSNKTKKYNIGELELKKMDGSIDISTFVGRFVLPRAERILEKQEGAGKSVSQSTD